MKKFFILLASAVAALPLLYSCEIDSESSKNHIGKDTLTSIGRKCMEASAVSSCRIVDDLLAIQEFLTLSDSEQNSDRNYPIRSRIVSKDGDGYIEVTDYGRIVTGTLPLDTEGGIWKMWDAEVKCVGDGHWTYASESDLRDYGLERISFTADIRRDPSNPKICSVAVSDGKWTPLGEGVFSVRFSTVSDFTIDLVSENMEGAFLAEVLKSGAAVDWVRIKSERNVGLGYSITVTSSR